MKEKYRHEVDKERVALLEPVVKKFHLGLDEVGALATIETTTLKSLIKKLCEAREKATPKPAEIVLDKLFMKKTADLLYTIAKTAVADGEKIVPTRMYNFSLVGFQLFNMYGKASALYNSCRDENDKKPEENKPVEGHTEATNNTQ
jgi:hypothetical protein